MYNIRQLILLALWLPTTVLAVGPATSAVTRVGVTQAQSQLDAGDATAALRTVDSYLASSPADPAARFLRGLALARLNHHVEAIDAFRSLIHDYSKLPEPYNNLGVLYAQQGDLILARDTLEAGLVEEPDYAPAQENLGDVYTALAAKSYSHALALNPDNTGLKSKLSLVGRLGTDASGAIVPAH